MTDWAVLSSLPTAEVAAIVQNGRRRRFGRGETLFHHGDPADTLHLLDKGHVAVRALTPQGEQAILSVLGPGDAFGELALLHDTARRTATVTAIEACETITLHRAQFGRLRARYPGIDAFLLSSLSSQVARLSDHLLEMLFMPTRLRVMQRVLNLAATFDGVIPLTQEDIALMCGTTRPTVNEVLREVERSGAIRIGRGRIEVLDTHRLAALLGRHPTRAVATG